MNTCGEAQLEFKVLEISILLFRLEINLKGEGNVFEHSASFTMKETAKIQDVSCYWSNVDEYFKIQSQPSATWKHENCNKKTFF